MKRHWPLPLNCLLSSGEANIKNLHTRQINTATKLELAIEWKGSKEQNIQVYQRKHSDSNFRRNGGWP